MSSSDWFVLFMLLLCGGFFLTLAAIGLGVIFSTKPTIETEKEENKMTEKKFEPMVVPEDKTMGWNVLRFIGSGEGLLTEPVEIVTGEGEFKKGSLPVGTPVKVQITKILEMRFFQANNPRVGDVYFAWNGRFGQPLIKQNPGRVVIYATQCPDGQWRYGGGREPRIHCNGEMLTPGGGYDPQAGTELMAINNMLEGPEKKAALEKFGKIQAARENLEESGLKVTDIHEIGVGISNRSIYMGDLTDLGPSFTGEHYYINEIPFSAITFEGDDYFIKLPEDKLGDVMPAPEWSGIQKLHFKTFEEYTDSIDSVAVAGVAKARTWLKRKYQNF